MHFAEHSLNVRQRLLRRRIRIAILTANRRRTESIVRTDMKCCQEFDLSTLPLFYGEGGIQSLRNRMLGFFA